MTTLVRRALPGWAAAQWLAQTGSTNTDLLEQAKAGLPQPRLQGAHLQHQGRGRANRNFRAEPGQTLIFSCSFATRLPIAALPTLSVYFGLLACEALAARLPPGHGLDLKWPNDLQWHGAKLAGILMETTSAPDGGVCVVIGMGLNLQDADVLATALQRRVADWSLTGCDAPAHELCADVARAWREGVTDLETAWHPAHGVPWLPGRYARHDALAGLAIVIRDGAIVLKQGTAAGITTQGALQIRIGELVETVYVGDISVRAHETPDRRG